MFNTADINIHRQPVVGGFRIKHALIVLRAGVARVVPGRLHKGIEGVGFTQRWLTVNGGFRPLRIGFNRAGDAVHNHIFRQDHRQLVFRRRHNGAIFQGYHRNWRTPVALAGNAPVAQTVVDFALAYAFGRQLVGNGVKRLVKRQAVEFSGVEQHAFFSQRLLGQIRRRAVLREDDGFDRQTVFGGEFPVALIVAGNGHDCASAVFHQYEVGNPYRNGFASQRMNGVEAGRQVTPMKVSGRVVYTVSLSARFSTSKVISTPSERPIQLRCMVLTVSGH